jgi:hypothetical protein
MKKLLRFIGVINAAIWFGSAVFVTVGLPALFSPEVGRYIQRPFVGIAAENILARYTVVQYCCAAIAIVHLLFEHFSLGRRVVRWKFTMLLALLAFTLLSGLWLQPKMSHLHYTKYWGTVVADRQEADKSFGRFHGLSQTANLLVIGCLVLYVWSVAGTPNDGNPRFSTLSKIRS